MERACTVVAVALALVGTPSARTTPPTDEPDRAAFRNWFTLLADSQFDQPAPEVNDCAALVRFAYREALRPLTAEWARRVGLPASPVYPDVRSGPKPAAAGWRLLRVSAGAHARFGEFAEARTSVMLNARRLGRDAHAARPGDLLFEPTLAAGRLLCVGSAMTAGLVLIIREATRRSGGGAPLVPGEPAT